ncbi:MBL fold metallo-hydrolase [Bacillus sp. A301a_S52]|jgi:phosphoribosyl 1,2-cyclic phosphodiesterase|nr:MBL fold metallo-hydrolase [Bacillus sp. A301a_S52]
MMRFNSFASGSAGNLYTLSDGITKIIIEAGISIKAIKKALNYKVHEVSGVLISHSHGDHSKSVKDIVKLGVDCYMSQETCEEIGVNHHRIKTIESLRAFKIGSLNIMPFDAEHDVKTFGFLIANKQSDKLLYLTDSYYCKYKFKALSHIAVECNYSLDILNKNIASGRVHKAMKKRLLRSHFSLENVKEFLRANDLSRVQEIHLLHLSDSNSDETRFKKEIQELTGKLVYVS